MLGKHPSPQTVGFLRTEDLSIFSRELAQNWNTMGTYKPLVNMTDMDGGRRLDGAMGEMERWKALFPMVKHWGNL